MTREDFQLIAAVMAESRPNIHEHGDQAHWCWVTSICRLADALENANPRFDRERFVQACYEQSL